MAKTCVSTIPKLELTASVSYSIANLRLREPSLSSKQFYSSIEASGGKVSSPASVIKPFIKVLTTFSFML